MRGAIKGKRDDRRNMEEGDYGGILLQEGPADGARLKATFDPSNCHQSLT